MSNDRKIYKPKAISGFPEWLPEERLVEQKWFDHIRKVFESYGFCNIETPSVEELDVMTAKGEVDKEIYVIERLHKDDSDRSEARLALHFDQTVPMARYVAMNFNNLVFPFKRYQMQRVWRGERPQVGRFREFYQCDIDIINVDNLPISFDAEVASVMYEVMEGLNIGRVQIRINNRKILMGLLESLNINDPTFVLRAVDKLEKIGDDEVSKLLIAEGLDKARINQILELSKIKGGTDVIQEIKPANDTMSQGITALCDVLTKLSHLPSEAVVADLSIVRGLDYYTGIVYETQLLDVPEFTGSVCSGGRYDDLAGSYINKHLPGVGISLGFSRLFDVIRTKRPDLLKIGPKSPTHVMMIMPEDKADQDSAYAAARTLRKNGVNVEMYHAPKKTGDQMKYASKKGIPYVWFATATNHQVKNMQDQTQNEADPQTWKAPA